MRGTARSLIANKADIFNVRFLGGIGAVSTGVRQEVQAALE